MDGVPISSYLEPLQLWGDFNQPITQVVWPRSLQLLSFSKRFNHSNAWVAWPPFLETLQFGQQFNQPIAGAVLSPALKQLDLGGHFSTRKSPRLCGRCPWRRFCLVTISIRTYRWSYVANFPPETCSHRQLQPAHPAERVADLAQRGGEFGCRFNQPVDAVQWRTSIQSISFGYDINQPIINVQWPASLRKLYKGNNFNEPIAEVK